MDKSEYLKERKKYLNGEITFQEFFEHIADVINVNEKNLPVSIERLKESTDSGLNDIPLSLWDAKHDIICAKASRAGLGRGWSISDTVSCLKAFARKLLREGT